MQRERERRWNGSAAVLGFFLCRSVNSCHHCVARRLWGSITGHFLWTGCTTFSLTRCQTPAIEVIHQRLWMSWGKLLRYWSRSTRSSTIAYLLGVANPPVRYSSWDFESVISVVQCGVHLGVGLMVWSQGRTARWVKNVCFCKHAAWCFREHWELWISEWII